MSQSTALYLLAGVVLLLIPIVPIMMAVRVSVLRYLRMNRLAAWHERHVVFLIRVVRIFLAGLAVLLLYLAASGA